MNNPKDEFFSECCQAEIDTSTDDFYCTKCKQSCFVIPKTIEPEVQADKNLKISVKDQIRTSSHLL